MLQHLAKFTLCNSALTHFKTRRKNVIQHLSRFTCLYFAACSRYYYDNSLLLMNALLIQLACKLLQEDLASHKEHPSKKRVSLFNSPLFTSCFPPLPPSRSWAKRTPASANGLIPLHFRLFINMHIRAVKMMMLKLSWSYFPFTFYKGR